MDRVIILSPDSQDRGGAGAHGSSRELTAEGDALLLADIFRGPGDNWLERPADFVDGVRAISVGMGGQRVRTGLPIKIDILTSVLIFPDYLYSSSTGPFGREEKTFLRRDVPAETF